MKILVVGSGGREHALVAKIKESPLVSEIYAAPGNAGMEGAATLVPIDASDVVKLARFANDLAIDLTVVGPEGPLFLGIEEQFRERDLPIVAPSQAAAELEGSKIFAKGFMQRHGIPSAGYQVCESAEQALQAIDEPACRFPVVVKADGQAQGKGVVVAHGRDEARAAIQTFMVDRRFGAAGDRVILEECLEGEEVSVFVLTDGRTVCPLVPAQDHKRLEDGDRGPNTGGMGAYSPAVQLSGPVYQDILKNIVLKTVTGMAEEGRTYRGVMFLGLMLTRDGPRVLEYNARLGDPEAHPVLARLRADIVPVLKALASGQLGDIHLDWRREFAVTVILASKGYPGDPMKGKPITGLEDAAEIPGVRIAHAGTKRQDDGFVTSGGRVLAVTALGPTLEKAVATAYQACNCIRYEGKILRCDIAARGMAHLKAQNLRTGFTGEFRIPFRGIERQP